MRYILVYDTETTGLPDWEQPSEAEHQPLAFALDQQALEVIHSRPPHRVP